MKKSRKMKKIPSFEEWIKQRCWRLNKKDGKYHSHFPSCEGETAPPKTEERIKDDYNKWVMKREDQAWFASNFGSRILGSSVPDKHESDMYYMLPDNTTSPPNTGERKLYEVVPDDESPGIDAPDNWLIASDSKRSYVLRPVSVPGEEREVAEWDNRQAEAMAREIIEHLGMGNTAAVYSIAKELIKLIKSYPDNPDQQPTSEQIEKAAEKPTAKQWLINFLNENAKKWRVEMGENTITYFLEDQWIFDIGLKSKYFWCNYFKVWEIFYGEYGMNYDKVQQLMRDVVLKPFNCEGFTPVSTMVDISTRY